MVWGVKQLTVTEAPKASSGHWCSGGVVVKVMGRWGRITPLGVSLAAQCFGQGDPFFWACFPSVKKNHKPSFGVERVKLRLPRGNDHKGTQSRTGGAALRGSWGGARP